jgi:hypothetical protein
MELGRAVFVCRSGRCLLQRSVSLSDVQGPALQWLCHRRPGRTACSRTAPLTFEGCLPGFSLLLHECVDEFDDEQLLAAGQH